MSNIPMTRPEEALAIHETRYFHSSTFTELEDGRVLARRWNKLQHIRRWWDHMV